MGKLMREKTCHLTARIGEGLMDFIDDVAKQRGLTRTDVVVRMLEDSRRMMTEADENRRESGRWMQVLMKRVTLLVAQNILTAASQYKDAPTSIPSSTDIASFAEWQQALQEIVTDLEGGR